MRRIRKLLRFMAFLAVIMLGLSGYLWYETRSQLHSVIALIKPFAEIRYGSLYASPFGAARVNRIEVLPYGVDAGMRIATVAIDGVNIFSIFNINRAFAQGRLPKWLNLSVRGVQVSVAADEHKTLYASAAASSLLQYLPCGETSIFNPAGSPPGFAGDTPELNVKLRYSINERTRLMQLGMSVELKNSSAAIGEMEADLTLANAFSSIPELATAPLQLHRLTLVLNDNAPVKWVNRFCAQRQGMTLASYEETQLAVLKRTLQAQGSNVDNGFIGAYQHFITDGIPLTLTAFADHPIRMTHLKDFDLRDMLDRLKFTVRFNQRSATPLSWKANTLETPDDSKKNTTSARMIGEAADSKPRRHPLLTLAEINEHLGSTAVVHTAAGGEHKGIIEAINHDSITLTRRMQGGSIAFTLKLNEIEKVLIVQ